MKTKSFAFGSVFAALAASLCCFGPLILGGLGLGTALAGTFAPLRPYFLALSATLLAVGFYFVYRKPKAPEPACANPSCPPGNPARRWTKPMLWVSTAAVLALAFFPSYGARLVSARRAPAAAPKARLATAQVRISGMDCEVCAGLIQKKLAGTSGIVRAEVSYPAGSATVQYDPAKIAPSKIVGAIDAAGYKAELTK